jgi:DNA-binding transcriptional MerR regulator
MISAHPLKTVQAAKILGISKSTLLRLFKDKKIDEVGRDRNNWRVFSPSDIVRIKQALEPKR